VSPGLDFTVAGPLQELVNIIEYREMNLPIRTWDG
jgi:hypothetical protein